ncbi:hypothetical protein DL765_000512 [Monosporascus sp. GIB2]|nr:hypothetical protein DL765_000512 [Monosporascus sp. GIB2]
MRFNLISTITVVAAVAVATPLGGSHKQKRNLETCNGGFCQDMFGENYECDEGSCADNDGAFCNPSFLEDGTRWTYCPLEYTDPGF